jgi:acyl-CoA reductase-like NAD-dependent aldehyde dehydrogenase
VHGSRHDEFLDLFLAETDRLTVGDPRRSTDVGPVIDAGSADRIESWVDLARAAGAGILRGGHRTGNVLDPTVLTGTAFGMRVEDEEVFGPVVTVNPIDTWAEGLARLNGSKYGLQLGVFTNDISKALSAADALDAGTVVVNDAPIYRIDTMPFGGVKDSGTGREGTKYAMESMTDTKLIILSASTTGASPKEHQQ